MASPITIKEMREISSEDSLNQQASGTWKFSKSVDDFTSLSAFIFNPYSELGKTTLKKLTESNLSVLISLPRLTNTKEIEELSENPFVKILQPDLELNFTQQLLYFIFFATSTSDIETFSHLTGKMSLETKKVLVVPLDLGQEILGRVTTQIKEKIVIVPSGFTTFPANSEADLFFKIISSFTTNTQLLLNPKDQSTLSFASFDELSNAILNVLFTGSKISTNWLIPEPLNLATTVAILQDSLSLVGNSPTIFQSNALVYNQQVVLPTSIPYWIPKSSFRQAASEILGRAKKVKGEFKVPLLHVKQDPFRLENIVNPSTYEQIPKISLPINKQRNFTSFKFIKSILKLFFVLLTIAVIAVAIFLLVTFWDIYNGLRLTSLNSNHSTEALQSAKSALRNIVLLDQAMVLLKNPSTAIGLGNLHQEFSSQISSFETFTLTEISTIRLFKDIQSSSVATQGATLNEQVLYSDLSETINNLTLSHQSLSSTTAWLNKLPIFGTRIEKIDKSSANIRQSLIDGQELLPFLSQLGGFDHQRKYLVLFQNNMELRPTGGFIGSYGLVTVQSGRISDFEVKDVYDADGQLKGHVEPPAPIKNVLGEAGWKLRDSNWDPDFPTSATRAQWFLEKETGEAVDGTVGITLKLAQAILDETGPVNLSDFQEQISKENIFEKAQLHSEANFFPGSSQKKDFLAALAQAIFEKLKKPTINKSVKLLEAFDQAIKERDLQFYFNDSNLQHSIQKLGWAGEMTNPKNCHPSNCVEDSLSIVDANLGVNKDNFALDKKYLDRITVDKSGHISHNLTLAFINKAQSEAWPLGRYKSYLRLYLPLQTKIDQIEMLNPSTGQREKIFKYDLTEEHNLKVIGFTFEVPVKESREVSISYNLSQTLNLTTDGSYFLSLHKQGGTNDGSYEVLFESPSTLSFIPVSSNTATQVKTFDLSSRVRYNLSLSSDVVINIKTRPKTKNL